LTGDCANLRYYNLCSGYLWIYTAWSAGEGAGVRFDGPCINPNSSIERVITYWRNTLPGYGATVDLYLDRDDGNDGCPDQTIIGMADVDPTLRWNCWDVDICIPDGASSVIVRALSDGGSSPNFATDGPFSDECDPLGATHSYYYGTDGSACIPWSALSPTGRADNLLFWLVVDSACQPTSSREATWGQVKGLYR
jgi:hypothetical protein